MKKEGVIRVFEKNISRETEKNLDYVMHTKK